MRFLDEEVLEVFVVHCDGATCESVSGYVCRRKRNRDLGALEELKWSFLGTLFSIRGACPYL